MSNALADILRSLHKEALSLAAEGGPKTAACGREICALVEQAYDSNVAGAVDQVARSLADIQMEAAKLGLVRLSTVRPYAKAIDGLVQQGLILARSEIPAQIRQTAR